MDISLAPECEAPASACNLQLLNQPLAYFRSPTTHDKLALNLGLVAVASQAVYQVAFEFPVLAASQSVISAGSNLLLAAAGPPDGLIDMTGECLELTPLT